MAANMYDPMMDTDSSHPGSRSPLIVAVLGSNDESSDSSKAHTRSRSHEWMSEEMAFDMNSGKETEEVFEATDNMYADELNMPCACVNMLGAIVDANESFRRAVGANDVSDIVNRMTILDFCFKEDLGHNLGVLQSLMCAESTDEQGPNQALLRALIPGKENGMYMALTLQVAEVRPGEFEKWISCVLMEASVVHAHLTNLVEAHREAGED